MRFRLNTVVALGKGALEELRQFEAARVLLVTDAFLATTEIFAKVRGMLHGQVSVFQDVKPNPTVAVIAAGVAKYLQAQPEVVIAYGGGSVIDAAKAMHKAALDVGAGAQLGLVAIPTTSGSGSEVTSFSVVTDEENQTKVPLVSPDLVPVLAILDPEPVVGVPPHVTADSGLDVLTHAIEAFVSKECNDFTDACAEKATVLVFRYLERCFVQGDDLDARRRMHNASCLAAMAFDNAGLGITHSMAHAIGGHFPVAHGRANAMLLPHVIEFNAKDPRTADRYGKLTHRIGKEAANLRVGVMNLVKAVTKLNAAVGVPAKITALGVDRDEYRDALPEMVASAMVDTCTGSNPVAPTEQDIRAILLKLL